MRSSAAERTRPTFWDALVVLAVLAAAGSLLFLFRPRSGNFLTARIRIAHSGCPNQDCVHIGWVSRSGGQIVCLPNRLVISVSGSDAPEVDGITG